MEYLNQRYRMQQEQDLLQTVQEMEAAVTHLRQFAAIILDEGHKMRAVKHPNLLP